MVGFGDLIMGAIRGDLLDIMLPMAESGDVAAMDVVGDIYLDGIMAEQDIGKAEYWYRKAAELGDRDAKRSLRTMRRKGLIEKE